jgi:hypothetical protein
MAAHRVVAADVVGCPDHGSEQGSVAARKKNRGGFRNPEPNPDLQEAQRYRRRYETQVSAASAGHVAHPAVIFT